MRRQSWFRALATLLAFWFPLIAGEPGLLHPCPMHGAGAAVAASVLGHAPDASSHASHAVMHHAGAQTAGKSGAPSHDHHNCTCIGGCCVSLTAAAAPCPATIEVTEVELATATAVSHAPTLARPAPEYSRPYTTGPPSA